MHTTIMACYALMLDILAEVSYAQQLSGVKSHLGYPGLSEQCRDAMRKDVSCFLLLNQVATRYALFKAIERPTTDRNPQWKGA